MIRLATPDEAREAARRILDDERFRPDPPAKPPQPFRQPLTWLGEQLQKLFEPLGRFLSDTVGRGGPIGWLLFALAIAAAVVLIARQLGRRIASRRTDTATEVRRSKRIAELERMAEEAAAAGRWSDAVRLRFRLGILRLEDTGRVTSVERRPNGEIVAALAARVPTAALRPLAAQHDRVAYGEQPAGRDDHDAAVAAWEHVRAEAGS